MILVIYRSNIRAVSMKIAWHLGAWLSLCIMYVNPQRSLNMNKFMRALGRVACTTVIVAKNAVPTAKAVASNAVKQVKVGFNQRQRESGIST